MNNKDLIQSIILKCETEITNGKDRPAAAGTLADEILALIDGLEPRRSSCPREFGDGFARFQFDRPIVCLDLEASSADVDTAKIIEFAAIKIHPDGSRESLQMLINPEFDITEEIETLTGITNADLTPCLPFDVYAYRIRDFIAGCYIMGYNARNFDVPLLSESLSGYGVSWLVKQDEILDPMEIFFKMEPRTLTGAAKLYAGKDHSDAHRAMPDVEITIDVLDGQLAIYQGLPDEIGALIQETRRDARLDLSGNIVLIDGQACFGFGKHKGKPCAGQRGYLKWMMGQNTFPRNTMALVDAIYDDGRTSDNPYLS